MFIFPATLREIRGSRLQCGHGSPKITLSKRGRRGLGQLQTMEGKMKEAERGKCVLRTQPFSSEGVGGEEAPRNEFLRKDRKNSVFPR